MKTPSSKEEWLHISAGLKDTWKFLHCIGAIDGKHIITECPKMTGSYYNCKGFYSIVLLAICGSNYCFTLFNLRHYGSNNDSGVLVKSKIREMIEARVLDIPAPSIYMTCDFDSLPYLLAGDEIFPLKTWLMRPYSGKLTKKQQVFNYCLLRARRTIENAFGILSARWRMFYTPIRAKTENAENYVLACSSLSNYLRLTDNASFCPNEFADSYDATGNLQQGEWRGQWESGVNYKKSCQRISLF